MKKGLTHIDWVISFSIFFLYLAFIFIFLKPVTVTNNSGKIALDIVESNLRDSIYWNVTRVPLFINCNSAGCTGSRDICIEIFPFAWNDNNILFTDSNGNMLQFLLGGSSSTRNCQLSFTTNFNSGQNLFWIAYVPGENIGLNNWNNCPSPCNNYIDSVDYNDKYGLPEFIIGISENRVSQLSSQDYDSLKSQYRLNNDFAIEMFDSRRNSVFSYVKITPGSRNVYVREWGDKILYSNLTFKPVIVNIKAF